MKDRRALKRRHLVFYLRVFDRNTNQLIGYLVDITPEGIMVMSENPIETDTTYQLRMVFPIEILGRKELNFDATSIWCKKDVFYDAGFELVDTSREQVGVIKHLIDRFGFRDLSGDTIT